MNRPAYGSFHQVSLQWCLAGLPALSQHRSAGADSTGASWEQGCLKKMASGSVEKTSGVLAATGAIGKSGLIRHTIFLFRFCLKFLFPLQSNLAEFL